MLVLFEYDTNFEFRYKSNEKNIDDWNVFVCFQKGFKVTKPQTVYEKFGCTEYFNTVMF